MHLLLTVFGSFLFFSISKDRWSFLLFIPFNLLLFFLTPTFYEKILQMHSLVSWKYLALGPRNANIFQHSVKGNKSLNTEKLNMKMKQKWLNRQLTNISLIVSLPGYLMFQTFQKFELSLCSREVPCVCPNFMSFPCLETLITKFPVSLCRGNHVSPPVLETDSY